MKERPIIFSAPMVSAILDGRKTQTRRVVKPQRDMVACQANPDGSYHFADDGPDDSAINGIYVGCPFGKPGDRLWVRETWCRLMDSWPGFTFRVLEISRTDWETLKEYAAMFVPLTHENNYTPPNPKECDHLVYRGCEIKPTDQ